MSDTEVLELTDREWEAQVEKSETPVVAMFHSPTCTHCKTMEPYFLEYAKEFEGKVKFVRLNVAAHQWIGERYGVRGTPTFKFFCGGKPVADLVGAIYPAILKKRIEEVLVFGEECAKHTSEVDYDITGYA